MSEFSPTHWVIVAVILAALLYGLWHAFRAAVAVRDWFARRAERKAGIHREG